jgi:4-hydroxybenzoate polyprenyltransferase
VDETQQFLFWPVVVAGLLDGVLFLMGTVSKNQRLAVAGLLLVATFVPAALGVAAR